MTEKLKNLIGKAQKTIQNLQSESENWSGLMSAGQFLSMHMGSTVSQLLDQFSINKNQLLENVVNANLIVESAQSEPVGRSSNNYDFSKIEQAKLAKPFFEEKLTPTEIGNLNSAPSLAKSKKVDLPFPSASIESEQVDPVKNSKAIGKILNRFSASQLEPSTVIDKKASGTVNLNKGAKDFNSGKDRNIKKHHFTSSSSKNNHDFEIPLTPKTDNSVNWFEEHKNIKKAASTIVNKQENSVDKKMLSNWLNPQSNSKNSPSLYAGGRLKKEQDNSFVSKNLAEENINTTKSYSPDIQKTETSNIIKNDNFRPEDNSQPASSLTPTSQLGKLVNSWQSTKSNSQKQTVEPVPLENKKNLPTQSSSSRSNGRDSNMSHLINKGEGVQSDQHFTDTLERILKREINRYGLGEFES